METGCSASKEAAPFPTLEPAVSSLSSSPPWPYWVNNLEFVPLSKREKQE